MKKSLVILFLISFFNVAKAQKDIKGIKFTDNLSWELIKEKAKKENKYIFLDIYTTWCVPCRLMASQVFTQQKVGSFFNKNFVNVAVQFDKTKTDSKTVKEWYNDVEVIKRTYKITEYPTYLFFNPDGLLVHKIIGATLNSELFVVKARSALDPQTQYLTLKRQYRQGKRDEKFLLNLLEVTQKSNDGQFLPEIANAYLKTQKNLLSDYNLKLISTETTKSSDPGFSVLKTYGQKIDSIAGKGKANEIINTIAFDEVVLPLLRKNGRKINYGGGMVDYAGALNKYVDWNQLQHTLNHYYVDRAEDIILLSKPMYYQWMKNWSLFVQSVSTYISHAKQINYDLINSDARTVFFSCDSPIYLKEAIAWSKITIDNNPDNPNYVDTYASLLYKSGNDQDAIQILNDASKSANGQVLEYYSALILKIKKKEKIW